MPYPGVLSPVAGYGRLRRTHEEASDETARARGCILVGRGCLFWLLVSVVLSVTLTVLINLVLLLVSG